MILFKAPLVWMPYLKGKMTTCMEQKFGLRPVNEEMPERGTGPMGVHNHPVLLGGIVEQYI